MIKSDRSKGIVMTEEWKRVLEVVVEVSKPGF